MTTDHFDTACRRLFEIEGGFSDDPNDSGGATRYGVTEAIARECGYDGPMDELPAETAREIAKDRFWDVLRLDEVAALSTVIAFELLDTGYNSGPGTAARYLQRALNAFNRSDQIEGPEWPEVKVDGALGPKTVESLTAMLTTNWPAGGADGMERIMMRALNAQQGVHFLRLSEKRQKDEKFTRGWFLNRVE